MFIRASSLKYSRKLSSERFELSGAEGIRHPIKKDARDRRGARGIEFFWRTDSDLMLEVSLH
jgi:hypothetical protein